jgi:YVTN family beta-propeller protein
MSPRNLAGLPLIMALALAGCPAPADRTTDRDGEPPVLSGTVYTADEGSNSVSMVDLSSGQARQESLPISPHNIQISDDGSLLLLVGPLAGSADGDHAHGDAGGGLLVVLDPETLAETRPAIPAGEHPAHVVVDQDNRYAYITDSGSNTVIVVDLESGRLVREIATCAYPHGLRLSPDGQELYVACVEANEVAVIDVAAGRETARIEVGRAPVQVGFSPDGRRVYVSLRDENVVAAIRTGTHELLSTVPVGRGPIQVHVSADGRFVFAANEGTEEAPDNTVSVIDARTHEIVATVTTGAGAHGVAVSPDGRLALVSNLFEGTVSVIDVESGRVVATHAVGDRPAGITYRP